MIIFDAHLDLAMNAMEWNRDLRLSLAELREREQGLSDKPGRGNTTVSFPEMRRGGIGLCVATLIARYVRRENPLPGWQSPEQAWAQTQGQLAWYRAMEEAGELKAISDKAGLEQHLKRWQQAGPAEWLQLPIGYVLSLEGADSIRSPEHLELAWMQGLRALGPAHYGPGVYAQGTDATGGLGPLGRDLLRKMESLNIILDATHLCDDSFWEALGYFQGPVWASHSNCRALVEHNRQFSDEQLRELLSRGAVIGAPLDAWMMIPGWLRGVSIPAEMGVSLHHMVDHMDHICQLAGNARQIGIGSDLDGGFGKEQCPADLDSIADLQILPELLSDRGFSDEEVEGIMWRNWMDFLRKVWK